MFRYVSISSTYSGQSVGWSMVSQTHFQISTLPASLDHAMSYIF